MSVPAANSQMRCLSNPRHDNDSRGVNGDCTRCFPETVISGSLPTVSNNAQPRITGFGVPDRREPQVRPYSQARRIGYGLLWTFWTVALLVGGFAAIGSTPAGLLGIGLGLLSAWYAYRIWTFRAKRLIFFIIF